MALHDSWEARFDDGPRADRNGHTEAVDQGRAGRLGLEDDGSRDGRADIYFHLAEDVGLLKAHLDTGCDRDRLPDLSAVGSRSVQVDSDRPDVENHLVQLELGCHSRDDFRIELRGADPVERDGDGLPFADSGRRRNCYGSSKGARQCSGYGSAGRDVGEEVQRSRTITRILKADFFDLVDLPEGHVSSLCAGRERQRVPEVGYGIGSVEKHADRKYPDPES